MNKKYQSKQAADKVSSELTQTESLIRDKLVIEYHFGVSESPFAKEKRLASERNSTTKESSQEENGEKNRKPNSGFSLPKTPGNNLTGFADYNILMDDCDDDESSGVIEFFVKKTKSQETSPKVMADKARRIKAGKRSSVMHTRF